ncbi:class I SAM-dependent methyltransferase [Aquipseudomonas alcaligenes]
MSDDNRQQIDRSWRANAGAWTDAVRGRRIESRRLATDGAMLDALVARAPQRVLDLGCGEGWLCRALAERGIATLGMDASPGLVELARAAGGAFECCDYQSFIEQPLRFGRFDAMACNFALLEEDLQPLLTAIGLALAAGGALLLQTVHPWTAAGEEGYRDGWRLETFAAFGGAFAEPMPWYFRTLESWLALLGRSGLVLEALHEPRHPDSGVPLSLLLITRPQG